MFPVQILWTAHGNAVWKERAFATPQAVQSTAGDRCHSGLLGNGNAGAGIDCGDWRGGGLPRGSRKALRFEREYAARSAGRGVSSDRPLRTQSPDKTPGRPADDSGSEGLRHYGSETVWRTLLHDFVAD